MKSAFIGRREFIRDLAIFTAAGWTITGLAGCSAPPASGARLTARPHKPVGTVRPGLQSLGLTQERDTQLYVPTSYRADRPATLILGLHGATQDSDFTGYILRDACESAGHLLLAPNSRDVSWDVVHGTVGEDELLLDRALEWCFNRCNVSNVVIAGFSDGASVALSLGLINGDLFQRIVAFSPGFIVGDERHGSPKIFISHGTRDQILPIDQTSRRLVPSLRGQGYSVTFHEFDGKHGVPPDVVAEMFKWLAVSE